MAKIEVEEADFLAARNLYGVVGQMLQNPAAKELLLKARKAADPNAVIPELDARQAVTGDLEAIRKELAADREQRAKEKAEQDDQRRVSEFTQSWEKQKQILRDNNWTAEGISAIEQHAKDRGIPDLEVAAAHYEKLHPPSEPVQPNGFGSWGFFDQVTEDDTFVKKMLESKGEDEGALNAEVRAALADARTPARR